MKGGMLIASLIFCMLSANGASEDEETIVCPGRGERCAYVEILGIKIWSKKDKGGPGIIIVEKSLEK